MVGVPGKFKGCETCRLRRVKCDNIKPYCRKCQDTGRQCAGYERETVFIVGTLEDGGRCSSHPPRVIKSKKPSAVPIDGGSNSTGSSSNLVGSGARRKSDDSKRRSSSRSKANSRSTSVSTSSSPAASSPSTSARRKPSTTPPHGLTSASFDAAAMTTTPTAAIFSGTPNVAQAGSSGQASLDLVPIPPLLSAWSDAQTICANSMAYQMRVIALSTRLQSVFRQRDSSNSSSPGSFVLPPFLVYTHISAHTPYADDTFRLSAQCMIQLASGGSYPSFSGTSTDSICLFLYEHNSPLLTGVPPPWKDHVMQDSSIQQNGPAHFVVFPGHHFFVRVYRPTAIWTALISRKATFLSDTEWTSVPWRAHPKSVIDRLLDIAVLLPVLLARVDGILQEQPTMARRMQAQDLLANSLYIEQLLEQWRGVLQEMGTQGVSRVSGASTMISTSGAQDAGVAGMPRASGRPAGGVRNWCWMADPSTTSGQIPFAETLAFRDGSSALMLVYYWSVLMLLYPCIESLKFAVFQPVLDVFPSPYPNLPPGLQMANTAQYEAKSVGELAASVCRGLDFALATTLQPDLLAAPLAVVDLFYRRINATSGNTTIELLWCEAFRNRLTAKGQYMSGLVQNQQWIDVARY